MSSNYRSILNVQGSSFASTNSFTFDGNSDFIDLGSSSTVADGGQFSFSFWIKGGSQATNSYLFSADYYNLHTFWLVSGTNFQWMNINGVKSNLSIGVLDNNWHHILIIFNPDGANSTIRCFTDGANEVNVSTDYRYGTGGIYKGALQYIGKRSGTFNGFNGVLDEIAVWNGLDLSSDVSTIYNGGIPNNLNDLTNTPTSWWRMGEAANYAGGQWTLTDQGSGGNDGTSTTLPAPPAQPSTDVPT